MNDYATNQANKRLVWDYWQALQAGSPGEIEAVLRRYCSDDHRWRGYDPVGDLHGADEVGDGFWAPLLASLPDLERKTWLLFGGRSNGRIDGRGDEGLWVTGTGVLSGTFARDYLSIPATGSRVEIRWGEFCRVEEGRVTETYFLIDMIDLIRQAGFQVLPPSRSKVPSLPQA